MIPHTSVGSSEASEVQRPLYHIFGANVVGSLKVILGIITNLHIISCSDISRLSALIARGSLHIHTHHSLNLRLNNLARNTADRPGGMFNNSIMHILKMSSFSYFFQWNQTFALFSSIGCPPSRVQVGLLMRFLNYLHS